MGHLWLEALGWALLHSLWQGGVAALLLALLLPLFRAGHRYALALGTLFAFPVLFGVTALSSYPSLSESTAVMSGGGYGSAWRGVSSWEGTRLGSGFDLEPFLPYLVVLWLVGVTVSLLRLVVGWRYLRGVRRQTVPVPFAWQRRFEVLCRTLDVRVTTLRLAHVAVPTVVGVVRPVVLLPVSALSGLTPGQLETILLHELAHIRRYDPLVNLLQSGIEALFFYHPALRWVSRVVREEREVCCDAEVVRRTGDAVTYAQALLALEQVRATSHQAPQLALAATGGSLMKRIYRLVGRPEKVSVPARLLAVALLIAGLLAACVSGTTSRANSLADYATVCLRANVATGEHEMAAFNAASVRAMSKVLAAHDLEVRDSCAGALTLAYQMTFDAQALNWQAELRAVDNRVLWQAAEANAIVSNGAFQYTTESTAEALLGQFLAARASR